MRTRQEYYQIFRFQHTAARRRLGGLKRSSEMDLRVSTHSRPKAAGLSMMAVFFGCSVFQHTAARRRLEARRRMPPSRLSFNTQPPEGGWTALSDGLRGLLLFQHTAARRRLG